MTTTTAALAQSAMTSPSNTQARVHIEFPKDLQSMVQGKEEDDRSLGSTDSESSSCMYPEGRSKDDLDDDDDGGGEGVSSIQDDSSNRPPRSETPESTITIEESNNGAVTVPKFSRSTTWPIKGIPRELQDLGYARCPVLSHPSHHWRVKKGKLTPPKNAVVHAMERVKISDDDDEHKMSARNVMWPGSIVGSPSGPPKNKKDNSQKSSQAVPIATRVGPCDRPRHSVEKICKETGKVLETFDTAAAASKDAQCKYASTFRRWLHRGSCEYNGFHWRYADRPEETTTTATTETTLAAPQPKKCGARVATPVEKICMKTGQVVAAFKSKSDACRSIGMQADGYLRTLLQGGNCEYKGFHWRCTADIKKTGFASVDSAPKKLERSRGVPVVKICTKTNQIVERFISVNAAAKSAGYKSRSCFYFKLTRGDCYREGYRWEFASITSTKRPREDIEDASSSESDTASESKPRKMPKLGDSNNDEHVKLRWANAGCLSS